MMLHKCGVLWTQRKHVGSHAFVTLANEHAKQIRRLKRLDPASRPLAQDDVGRRKMVSALSDTWRVLDGRGPTQCEGYGMRGDTVWKLLAMSTAFHLGARLGVLPNCVGEQMLSIATTTHAVLEHMTTAGGVMTDVSGSHRQCVALSVCHITSGIREWELLVHDELLSTFDGIRSESLEPKTTTMSILSSFFEEGDLGVQRRCLLGIPLRLFAACFNSFQTRGSAVMVGYDRVLMTALLHTLSLGTFTFDDQDSVNAFQSLVVKELLTGDKISIHSSHSNRYRPPAAGCHAAMLPTHRWSLLHCLLSHNMEALEALCQFSLSHRDEPPCGDVAVDASLRATLKEVSAAVSSVPWRCVSGLAKDVATTKDMTAEVTVPRTSYSFPLLVSGGSGSIFFHQAEEASLTHDLVCLTPTMSATQVVRVVETMNHRACLKNLSRSETTRRLMESTLRVALLRFSMLILAAKVDHGSSNGEDEESMSEMIRRLRRSVNELTLRLNISDEDLPRAYWTCLRTFLD